MTGNPAHGIFENPVMNGAPSGKWRNSPLASVARGMPLGGVIACNVTVWNGRRDESRRGTHECVRHKRHGGGRQRALSTGMKQSSELTKMHPTVRDRRKPGGPASAGQSGDLQGLTDVAGADSESVQELLEEGQAFEAEAVRGVENAPDADVAEVRTKQFPEDDVPEEYLERADKP